MQTSSTIKTNLLCNRKQTGG